MLNIGIITTNTTKSLNFNDHLLFQINGKTIFQYHLQRLNKAGFPVFFYNDIENEVLKGICKEYNVEYFLSENTPLLNALETLISTFQLETIVLVNSQSPLIDQHLIRNGVEKYLRFNNTRLLVSNCFEPTFSKGFEFEIFSSAQISHLIEDNNYRKLRNQQSKFESYSVKQNNNHSFLDVTIENARNLKLLQKLINEFGAADLPYNTIEEILIKHPELYN